MIKIHRRLLGAAMRAAMVAVLLITGDFVWADWFDSEVEPILKTHCLECHGPDEQEGSFRVDRLARLLRGGESGEPAVVPEAPDRSFLLRVVRHQEAGYEMPPDGRLSDTEIDILEKWILAGAKTPEHYGPVKETIELSHWSFLPLENKVGSAANQSRLPAESNASDGFAEDSPPVVSSGTLAAHALSPSEQLDVYVRQRLSDSGLAPSSRAQRRTLIRRLYLIMHGIPPTPEQVARFVNDLSSDSWERLVSDVLESELFGERFASLWLDLIRFGETHGYEMNRERPTAWPFRDWVIDCFNQDMPYDQFIQAQIAGDSVGLPIGTGFLVAGPVDQVKGQDPKLRLNQRMNELDDMINTVGTAFLGLTTGCARCHDHKFDPISQTDYYALQAVFAGVNHGDGNLPLTDNQQLRVAELEEDEKELLSRLSPFLPRLRENGCVRVIDESQATHLVEAKGSADRVTEPSVDWSRGSYTWWNHDPEHPVVQYEPKLSGHYRIWLSWGAGFSTHTTRASYRLLASGDENVIATVNQQLRADGSGKVDQMKRWSGFFDAGIHLLSPADSLLLYGGNDAAAVTADVVVFEEVDVETAKESSGFSLMPRSSVSPLMNIESFTTREAKAIRFWIDGTNQSEPCIDELEVFDGGRNVALASSGAIASSSGDFVHPTHKLSQINDGEFGNPRSWISSQVSGGWVQIDFADLYQVDRIQWARDRTGQFADRTAVDYRIELMRADGQWEYVAGSSDRLVPQVSGGKEPQYRFDSFPDSEAEKGRRWLEELTSVRQELEQIQKSRVAYVGQFSQPGATHRLYRGEPSSPREQVVPSAIEALSKLKMDAASPESERRRMLADWIASEENPLTARVIVNRIWQFHFGEGIVSTPSDLGRNGAEPSHPELLDWLAGELIRSDWSLKHIHRLILLSDTWCQDHLPVEQALKLDAGNRLLWRFAPRRMEAESIRDSILAVSGVLDLDSRGGPGFSAFEVQMENVRHYHPKEDYGPEDWRRMVYMTKVRQEKDQVFGVFDCPDASMVVAKRSRSTTPLQALSLLNSRFVLQQSNLLAERVRGEVTDDSDTSLLVSKVWQLCCQRNPTPPELAASLTLVEQYGLPALSRALFNANEFVFIP